MHFLPLSTMKQLEIIELGETNSTPQVSADPQKHQLVLKGRSLPVDAYSFYQPIIDWLSKYGASDNSELDLIIQLTFLNSGSSKRLIDLFECADRLSQNGCRTDIEWHYNDNSDDIYAAGKEYSSLVSVPFKLVKSNKN